MEQTKQDRLAGTRIVLRANMDAVGGLKMPPQERAQGSRCAMREEDEWNRHRSQN